MVMFTINVARNDALEETEKIKLYRDAINIPDEITNHDIGYIFSYIHEPRFKRVKTEGGVIAFDLLKDFDLIYGEFRRQFNINLLEDNIHWWEFNSMLEVLLLTDNALTKRMGFRVYKNDAQNPNNQYYLDKKFEYSITQSEKDINRQLGQMFRGLERRAKKE